MILNNSGMERQIRMFSLNTANEFDLTRSSFNSVISHES